MATKKVAKKKTTSKAKAKAKSNGLTFTDDIPKVTRQGSGNRSSKYDELLDQLVEARTTKRKTPTARMEFDTVGKATSRYQSIKSAIEKREDDSHLFVVAQRSEGDEDEPVRAVYVKYDPTLPEPDEDESGDPEDADEVDEDEDDEDVDF